MLFEFCKIIKRKVSLFCAGGLFFSMIIYTLLLIYGTIDLNSEYIRAGLPLIDTRLSFYFYPSEFAARVPDPYYNIYTLLHAFFLIPILLTFVGATSFNDDHQANLINQLASKKGMAVYLLHKMMICFLSGFILVWLSIIFQALFASLLVRMINNNVVRYFSPALSEITAILISAIKISLYYACVMLFSASVGLFTARVKYLPYFIPLILSTLLTFSFPRIPLALAFSYSGYRNKSQMLLYIVVSALAVLSVLFNLIYIRSTRKRLI